MIDHDARLFTLYQPTVTWLLDSPGWCFAALREILFHEPEPPTNPCISSPVWGQEHTNLQRGAVGQLIPIPSLK